ncbi:MAG TPA: helix-turn-helix domain-containing protein [Limnobacter sp.]|uniref:helix-turn-helix domain-containing protein n=1 Tax=Limnobacter sp. TaxID=2003368 RepID=UPI002EDAC51F
MKTDINMRAWYWRHGFLLGAHRYVLKRSKRPYRRFSATVIIGLSGDVQVEIGDGVSITTRAIVLAPKVMRLNTVALDSDVVILDIHVSAVEFPLLEALLGGEQFKVLDLALLAPVQTELMGAVTGALPAGRVYPLVQQAVALLCGQQALVQVDYPAPVKKVISILEAGPMDQVSVKALAQQVCLSESRLRAVFSKRMGCTISEYMRWLAVWKAIWMWSAGQPLIEVAVEIGFYDLAHLNKAFNEIFGMNPSDVFKSEHVEVLRCDA